ncbi:MAG: hypothetical protein ABI705_11855, partial [Aestuariivirga sp.]
HHSRPLLGGTPDIGLPGGKRKGQSTTLKTLFSGILSKVYMNYHGDNGKRTGVPCFVLVKRIG